MADMNELLQQAADEAEGLGREALRAQDAVARLARLAAGLATAVEAGSEEGQLLLDQLSTRVTEAEAEMAKESTAATAGLRELAVAAARLRGDTADFRQHVLAQLELLRQEKGHALEGVEAESDSAAGALTRYTDTVSALEAATDARLLESRRAIETLSLQAEDARQSLSTRGDALVAQLHYLEEVARFQLHGLMEAYDVLVASLRDQVGEIQASVKGLSDQATGELTRVLSREVIGALEDAAKPMREALDALMDWAKRSRGHHEDRFGELGSRLQDVTRALEGLKGPLDMVRQHLH